MNKVQIRGAYIKLGDFLKFAAMAESGGAAKNAVLSGEVKVNGEVCLMRGKKLHDSDVVSYAGMTAEVCGDS